MTNPVSFKAYWGDVLARLSRLLPPVATILEIDRVMCAMPSSWRADGTRILTTIPLAYARQLDERGLAIVQHGAAAYLGWFVSEADVNERYERDPIGGAAAPPSPMLRGRTIDTIARSARAIDLMVFGGMGGRLDLLRSGFDAIGDHQPILLFRLESAGADAQDVTEFLRDCGSYEALTAKEIGLPNVDGLWAEEIMIAVPSFYEKEALSAMGWPPQTLLDWPAGSSGTGRPFRPANTIRSAWPAQWIVSLDNLLARGFDRIESSDGMRWRWSNNAATEIYVEVPAPGRYRLRIKTLFYTNRDIGITRILVNGQEVFHTVRFEHVDFDVDLFRHALIVIQCPVHRAPSPDTRMLGVAISDLIVTGAGRNLDRSIGVHGEERPY